MTDPAGEEFEQGVRDVIQVEATFYGFLKQFFTIRSTTSRTSTRCSTR